MQSLSASSSYLRLGRPFQPQFWLVGFIHSSVVVEVFCAKKCVICATQAAVARFLRRLPAGWRTYRILVDLVLQKKNENVPKFTKNAAKEDRQEGGLGPLSVERSDLAAFLVNFGTFFIFFAKLNQQGFLIRWWG